MQPKQIVEALLFASDAPLAPSDLARADDGLDEELVRDAIQVLREEYERGRHAFQIYELAGGFQLLTRPDYAPYLERFATVSRPGRLSPAALEVLAIIAYRQPIGRVEVEEIRGVGSVGVLRTLQERELIDVVGRGEGLGRPLLYGVTERFLEHFGLRSMDDLPRPEDLPVVLRERVEALTDDPGEEAGQGGEGDQGREGEQPGAHSIAGAGGEVRPGGTDEERAGPGERDEAAVASVDETDRG